MNPTIAAIIRARVARLATGASAVRSYPKDTGKTARRYFADEFPLGDFAGCDGAKFTALLDAQTLELARRLPNPDKRRNLWGISRKLINIFLRDCHYTHQLRLDYDLAGLEPHLEVPLDRVCAEAIRKWCKNHGREFGDPFSIDTLTAARSNVLQAYAAQIAYPYGYYRVHLDALWWAHERN